jgi:syntaxin-binding protein 1
MDMMIPFIHEFTYQAMANDLLPIKDGTSYMYASDIGRNRLSSCACSRYKFQSSVGAYEDMTATLTDADSVWTEVRHMHMRETIDKLMADFNKFLEENAVFKGYFCIHYDDC